MNESHANAPADPAQAAALHALLRERRTVHEFRAEPVPEELVVAAVDIARWAPNHRRTEPWHFYLLGERMRAAVTALNTELVRAAQGERAAEVKQQRWLAMPGWLVLTCERNEDRVREQEDYAACCCAAQNFMLALWASGIGAKWTTGAVTRNAAFFSLLDIAPEREFVVGLFWYGWPAVVGEQQRRPLASALVYRA